MVEFNYLFHIGIIFSHGLARGKSVTGLSMFRFESYNIEIHYLYNKQGERQFTALRGKSGVVQKTCVLVDNGRVESGPDYRYAGKFLFFKNSGWR